MPIYYALHENNLTTDPTDYAASVQINASLNLDAVADRMISQGSTVTRPDIMAVLEDTVAACEALLVEGNRVNFGGLVELFPRLSGVFNGATDSYDPARHQVDVGANPGARLRKAVRSKASVQKIPAVTPVPVLLEYADLGSGEHNRVVTPGNIGTISGSRLKYDATKPDEGIFFVPESAGAAVKVTALQRNKPSQLVFLVPAGLAADDYSLEVRARIAGALDLRVGRLAATLMVP